MVIHSFIRSFIHSFACEVLPDAAAARRGEPHSLTFETSLLLLTIIIIIIIEKQMPVRCGHAYDVATAKPT
eukprot:8581101-Pyramimonas_sp.AAC.2